MSEKLDEIRKKIDSLDNQIHDLLMQRADLIVDVSEEKKKSNIPVVQPAREAVMIRRLLKRHKGPLPEAAIVGIWRELVGAVSLLQTGLKVAVSAGEGQGYCWDMARIYFGTVLPMTRTSGSIAAVAAVREDEATFAVVPWPQDGEKTPWWTFLAAQEKGQKDRLRIVCALPYGLTEEQNKTNHDRAMIVSKTSFQPSGEDHSFLALEVSAAVSRARVLDVFKALDLKLLTLNTRPAMAGRSLHFIEMNDFIAEDDKKLKEIEEKFEGQAAKCVALGGYPVPPIFKAKKVVKNV